MEGVSHVLCCSRVSRAAGVVQEVDCATPRYWIPGGDLLTQPGLHDLIPALLCISTKLSFPGIHCALANLQQLAIVMPFVGIINMIDQVEDFPLIPLSVLEGGLGF